MDLKDRLSNDLFKLSHQCEKLSYRVHRQWVHITANLLFGDSIARRLALMDKLQAQINDLRAELERQIPNGN